VDAGRRRTVVLLATLGTFGAALAGLYALTGLWLAHDAADRWAVAIAFAVAASGAVDKALSPWADHASPATAPPDEDPSDPPPEPPGGTRTRSRARVMTAVTTAAVTAAVTGIVYGVLAPKGATASQGDTLVYARRTLSLKNYDYYFDLRAGAVTRSETRWSVSTNAGGDGDGAFELQPLTDAYVLPGKTVPTVGRCAAKATSHPTDGRLHFRQAPPGSTVCLRDTKNGDIAVLTVMDVDHGNYAATAEITYYRHGN
jgi:hypothetical protein